MFLPKPYPDHILSKAVLPTVHALLRRLLLALLLTLAPALAPAQTPPQMASLLGIAPAQAQSLINMTFQASGTDVASVSYTRNAGYDGGTHGFVNSGIRVTTNITGAAQSFEWGILSILNRNNASSTGEHVALYGQANNNAPGGEIWGEVIEVHNNDTSGTSLAVGREADFGGHINVGYDNVILAGAQVDTLFRTQGPGHITAGIDITADIGITLRGAGPMYMFYNPDRQIGLVLINRTVSVTGPGGFILPLATVP